MSIGPLSGDQRRQQVRAAETRLLYENACTGLVSSSLIACLLGYAQWDVVSHVVVSAWVIFMLLVAAARYVLMRRYLRASPSDAESGRWNSLFVVVTALTAAGWCVAAIVLYPLAPPMHEAFVVFVIGGVMLGGASLLAARPEAFLTFLLPTGIITALRVASVGDEDHLMMGFLAGLFTVATLVTTWKFHRTIESSLKLRFDNSCGWSTISWTSHASPPTRFTCVVNRTSLRA